MKCQNGTTNEEEQKNDQYKMEITSCDVQLRGTEKKIQAGKNTSQQYKYNTRWRSEKDQGEVKKV